VDEIGRRIARRVDVSLKGLMHRLKVLVRLGLRVVGAVEEVGVAREATRAALMGARGNSGVILSQIVRGIGESLAAEESIDGAAVARVLRAGSDAAYRAVRKPVEGTMLTAIRALADAAEAEQLRSVGELLELLVTKGEEAVARTQEQLDVLREAGVVDAGAAGLVELLRGIASVVAGQPLPEEPPVERASVEAAHRELSRFRYCTTFVIEGDLDPDALEAEYEQLGDSLLVVGDEHALKVHVHTDNPGAALAIGTRVGAIENVEIADMHRQTEARERRLLAAVPDPPPAAAGVVAVVAGAGNQRLFESLGATQIVEGGQTMNPSAAELSKLCSIEVMIHDILHHQLPKHALHGHETAFGDDVIPIRPRQDHADGLDLPA